MVRKKKTPESAIEERSEAMSMRKVKMNHPNRKKPTPCPNMASSSYADEMADHGETMKAYESQNPP